MPQLRVQQVRVGEEMGDGPAAISLEPVDGVTVTTLVDNAVDMLLGDQGPAKRLGLAKLEVSGAAESLQIRITCCQLGCF